MNPTAMNWIKLNIFSSYLLDKAEDSLEKSIIASSGIFTGKNSE